MPKLEKNNQVVFYYPQHFNRGVLGENLLFKPFLDYCNKNGVAYKLVEEPSKDSINPSNKKAEKFNLFFVLVLRKLLPLVLFENFEIREQFIGKIYRFFTANHYHADVVFTLSNSLGGFWRGYNPKAKIIDYQHGIINKGQTGFFNNKKAPLHIKQNGKEVAVWGKNFKTIFEQDHEYYNNKVHVLGYSLELQQKAIKLKERNTIVFTLQFMPDIGAQMNKDMLEKLEVTLNDFNKLQEENRPKIILKQHPRHNDVVNLEAVIQNHNSVNILGESEFLNLDEVLINVTFFSTAAFEMAQCGVPSYFLFNKALPQGKEVFMEEYNYPLQLTPSLLEFWRSYQENSSLWVNHSKNVVEWVNDFFEPFDNDMLEQLIIMKSNES